MRDKRRFGGFVYQAAKRCCARGEEKPQHKVLIIIHDLFCYSSKTVRSLKTAETRLRPQQQKRKRKGKLYNKVETKYMIYGPASLAEERNVAINLVL